MYLLRYDGYADIWFLSDENIEILFDAGSFLELARENALVFCDLDTNGMYLLNFFKKNGFELKNVVAHNLRVQVIYFDKVVIKNCASFDFVISDTTRGESFDYLNSLSAFLSRHLHKTLYDYDVNSLASLSVCFLKKFGCRAFIDLHAENELFVREAYYGGRCELYNPGLHKNVFFYDFPAMYGSIMTGAFPTNFLKKRKCNKFDASVAGFYRVLVEQPNSIQYELLPYRSQCGVFYASGVFGGVYYSEELLFFIENGGIILEVYEVMEFYGFEPVLKETAEFLLALKGAGVVFAKKILNSIYGRLAINTNQFITRVYYGEDAMRKINESCNYTSYNDIFLVEEPPKLKKQLDRNLALSAIVASRARIKLAELVLKCLRAGCLIVYVDTDSVFLVPKCADYLFLKTNLKFECLGRYIFYSEKTYSSANGLVGGGGGVCDKSCVSFKRKKLGKTYLAYTAQELRLS